MKILFLTDNFPPELNAPANRSFEHCKEWVRQGAELTVITCFPNFPGGKVFDGYKNRLYQVEEIEGIRVIRIWSYIAPNRGTMKRILDFLSFGIGAVIAGVFVPKPDIILATSPQFFTAVGGRVLSLIRRCPWVMEIRDLWPESIEAVGAIRSGRLIRMLERVERHLYRSADHLIVVTDTFKKRIHDKGIPESKISVIKNGVNRVQFHTRPKNLNLIKQLGLEGKFIIGYIGTHGMAHGLELFVKAVDQMPEGVHLLLIGDGAEKEHIRQTAEHLRTNRLTLLDPIPRQDIPNYLSILDVALVPLRRRETFKTVIPSKIFEAAAMEIPILLGVEGESADMLRSYNAGLCFIPEDLTDFLKNLKIMRKNSNLYRSFQEGGRRLAEDFSRKVLAGRMLEIINRLV